MRPQVAEFAAAEFAAAGLSLMLIDRACDFGLTSAYATPETLGVDRLVGAAAARHFHGGRDLIVIDAGTATTVDYVTAAGEFLGGVIAPGLKSAAAGLGLKAPLLPTVELTAPERVIGRSTVECLRAGSVVGHAAMLRGLVELMKAERGGEPLVLLTGGFTRLLAPWLPEGWIADEHLTLKGIKVVYELNRH
ncbi:MAG: Type III pantothenate kinase [Deltaproteobacteria bacterium ADurb.Bin510]|nr:MAG: Type III pantothenate kinase [Deltaproteobacteria bacterium ADurb.Bin510]